MSPDIAISGETVTEFEGFHFTEANFAERLVYSGNDQQVILKRHRNGGGWVPVDQDWDNPNKAFVADDVYVGPRAMVLGPAKIHGGWFYGGTFHGGQFESGTFHGGQFYGGTFHGGRFEGGAFEGGAFHGGSFESGMFHGGTFESGTFHGGQFYDKGAVYNSALKTYHSSTDADNASQLS
jgi:hypothetical protein